MNENWEALQEQIIGLGEQSLKKNYYAELRRRLTDLERFRQLLDQSNDFIFVIDLDSGSIIDANETACRALGYRLEEFLGLTFNDIDPGAARRPRPGSLANGGEASGTEEGREQDAVITRLRSHDGREIPVELTIRATLLDRRAYAAMIARDITKRQKAEEALRQINDDLEQRVEARTQALTQEITERRQIETALRETEERFRDIALAASDWFWETDADHRFTYISGRFYDATSVSPDRVIGKSRRDLITAQELEGFPAKWQDHFQAVAAHRPFRNLDYGIVGDDGAVRYIRISGQPVHDAEGGFQGYRGAGTDITAAKLAEAALRHAHSDLETRVDERTRSLQSEIARRTQVEANLRKLSAAVEQSPTSVLITDAFGLIEYVNARFVETAGYAEAEAIGLNAAMLRSDATTQDTWRVIWETVGAGQDWRGELLIRRKDGNLFWEDIRMSPIKSAEGTITNVVIVGEDISARKDYEQRLLHQANFDTLTDLPNRILALDRLNHALSAASRSDRRVLLIFVDLDQFKRINDSLGHAAGDRLVVEAARRLTQCVREADTVARLGGDEFMVLVSDSDRGWHPEVIAERILRAIAVPFSLFDQDVFITASVGMTLYPDDGSDAHLLMRNADAALFKAKEAGRNGYRFFTAEMNRVAIERLALENHLRQALKRGELSLYYQPVIDPHVRRLVGAEALLRWDNPELGRVSPDRFIPLAEETGLIDAIDTWVLETACAEAATWQNLCRWPLRVSINQSPGQFKGLNLIDNAVRALSANALPPQCLQIEITERLLVNDAAETAEVMRELVRLGVSFAIDDFGTGYSSLSYLKRFPVSMLKIDKSFVQDVNTDPNDAALSKAIIAMAHSLGLTVVGEGVESWSQLDFLKIHRCDLIQGFYYGRPMPAPEFAEFARSPHQIRRR